MIINDDDIKQAIEIAKQARENAFVLNVDKKGACIISRRGKFYAGCNIETYISGLGICAERSAIDSAISNGDYEFIALVTFDKPCGMCLEYLDVFFQINKEDIPIYIANADGGYETKSLRELLPENYKPKHSLGKIQQYRNR